jgi:hypothetical protein
MFLNGLDDIKAHLRVTGTADDYLLSLYESAVREHIEELTGEPVVTPAPFALQAVALLLIADLYENREAQAAVALKANPTMDRLLFPFRSWDAPEEAE